MHTTPCVSVLMPAFNVEKYIATAIESCLKQTFTNFEFIIINDGSTDKTAKIIDKYAKKDKRIKFINNKKNAGIVATLNQGLDICCGKYIARMDSDDISLPTRFEKQVAYMETHPECGALGTWGEKFGENIKNRVLTYMPNVRLLDLLIHGCKILHPGSMIRRSVLITNNIKYKPEYEYAEDYALWAEICKHAQIHNLQEVLLKYRYHNNKISVVYKKTQQERAERVRQLILSQLLSYDTDKEKLLRMTREVQERFWLFGFLPIVRRKQYSIIKTKFYLFEKIPLIKEKDGDIYLFEYLKIGKLK